MHIRNYTVQYSVDLYTVFVNVSVICFKSSLRKYTEEKVEYSRVDKNGWNYFQNVEYVNSKYFLYIYDYKLYIILDPNGNVAFADKVQYHL